MSNNWGENVKGRTGENPIIDRNNGFVRASSMTPVVAAHLGAQNGPVTNIGKWVNNAGYVSRDVIAKVVDFPKWINYMPDPAMFRMMIKTFIEVQTKIDGLQSTITTEYHETELGNAGHKQFDFNKTTITHPEVSHSMMDKIGRPYQNLFELWQRFGGGDPESGIPLVHLLNENIQDHLPDMYSMTVLYFEPDIRRRSIEKAWLVTNMAPRGSGEKTGKKQMTTGGDQLDLNITFTGLADISYGVYDMALKELLALDRGGLNPMTRKAFVDKISSDVIATANGYWDAAKAARGNKASGLSGF